MIFIDWISEPNHKNFNRAFFSALKMDYPHYIVFSESLVIDNISCQLEERKEHRYAQAIKILKLVWKNRDKCIFFLTYDPIFVPLVRLLNKKIFVFEHNTTPLYGLSKHSIWQKLFFGKLHRMAQFPAQYERLSNLGAVVTYLGSPLISESARAQKDEVPEPSFTFLVPSYRADLSEIVRFSQIFKGSKIIVKKSAALIGDRSEASGYDIEALDRVELCYNDRKVDAVVITVQSRLRGTGWFNDAISNSVPILVTNKNARALFEETFPGHPFIDADNIMDSTEIRAALDEVRKYDTRKYVEKHNYNLRIRFLTACKKIDSRFL